MPDYGGVLKLIMPLLSEWLLTHYLVIATPHVLPHGSPYYIVTSLKGYPYSALLHTYIHNGLMVLYIQGLMSIVPLVYIL